MVKDQGLKTILLGRENDKKSVKLIIDVSDVKRKSWEASKVFPWGANYSSNAKKSY